MPDPLFAKDVHGLRLHFTGIKGVGMTALAEIMLARGALVSGTDTSEKFFTDEILKNLGIRVTESFAAGNLDPATDFVVYSAAYQPDQHPELLRARDLGIACFSYPEALGTLSLLSDSSGVCGVHGKTTTTALTGTLLKEAGLPVTVLVGSEVPGFGNRSTYIGGDRFLVAETCEYKRHFLHFTPTRLILTSIEPDHQDYFKDLDDLYRAFTEYALKLKPNGALIFCADDPGAALVAKRVQAIRTDVRFLPYGFSATGDYRISGERFEPGTTRFTLAGLDGEFVLHLPGRHSVRNSAAAIALAREIECAATGNNDPRVLADMRRALAGFSGTRRRSEIIGEAGGILFMDDYAHHPTAIRTTLDGLKRYYPDRRLIVDFMSHTYSRTQALLDEFAGSFGQADEVILHKIYASAREHNDGTVNGRTLFERTAARRQAVRYFEETADAVPYLKASLVPGDLFITMGAGDNWKLGRELFRHYSTPRSAS